MSSNESDTRPRFARVNKLKATYQIPEECREVSDSRFIYLRGAMFLGQYRIDIRTYRLMYDEVNEEGLSPLKPTQRGVSLTIEEATKLAIGLCDLLIENNVKISPITLPPDLDENALPKPSPRTLTKDIVQIAKGATTQNNSSFSDDDTNTTSLNEEQHKQPKSPAAKKKKESKK
jgi:hypothetical protein